MSYYEQVYTRLLNLVDSRCQQYYNVNIITVLLILLQ